jgi:hypothetical protein
MTRPFARRTRPPWMLFASFGLVLFGCDLADTSSSLSPAGSTPFSMPVPTASPFSPVFEATPTGMLFHDDFTDPLSGWDVRHDQDAITDFGSGEFVIYVGKADTALWSTANRYMTDVSIEVDARQVEGTDDSLYGVICRYQDRDNFYRFVIGGNGFAGITKRSRGTVTVISGEFLNVSTAVQRGLASNHLRAICQGTQLSFFVNGELVAQASDSEFSAGDTGLIAASSRYPGVRIRFSNYSVFQP